ncbi:MAG: type II and III secretion system protein family protein [Pseudomonadota bacterium]
MRGSLSRLLAVMLIAFAMPAAAQTEAPENGAPVSIKPEPAASGERAVVEDIEKTLRELSGVTVGARRITVNQPSTAARSDVTVPSLVDLSTGKSVDLNLPGNAREIVVGDPTVADVAVLTKRRLFVMGRKAGRTNIFVLDSSATVLARVEVAVGIDVEEVQNALRQALPNEAVEVRADRDNLILSGSVASDGAMGRVVAVARRFVQNDTNLVNLMRINREQQVLIQVRVAEVQRNFLKEIGVDTTLNSNARVINDSKLFGGHLTGSTAVLGLVKAGTNPAATFTFTGIRDIIVALNLLEERGIVRSLAEPNLVAVSGETASMLAGGEYPIPVPGEDGITIQYKPFGVTLSFLPVVTDAGRISMKLQTEVSALGSDTVSFSGGTVRSFTVRRAASTVELPNGGALMIAGLIQNDIVTGLAGVPGLMDVPILGQLFRSDSFKRNETELVVLVNATLVRPTAPSMLVSPADAISPGGDLDMWAFGNLTGRYTPGFTQDISSGDRFIPAFGFTIDEPVP